jgi:TolB-like protein/DNA-binding winged helix-turn-helix (wHTH) protein
MNQVPLDALQSGAEIYRVDDLTVDVGRQCVSRASVDLPLPNLSFRLLLALIHAAPNVLSNETLMARVWPGQVVSPETVNKRAKLLRDALGDDAREPRYIAGVRSRGYRLIAPVFAGVPDMPVSEPGPREPVLEVLPPGIRWRSMAVAGATLLLIVSCVLGVRSYRAHRQPAPDAPPAAVSVSVLPFENISADAADAYLAYGVPEMIISRMSQINGLSVIARSSSFSLPTKSIDSKEIGMRLKSQYLISGSVQRAADRLRVLVQLVDAAAGTVVWSARYDRQMHDIFEIEDEIADQVGEALAVRRGAAKPKPSPSARSANVQAYLAFLRGRTLLGRFTVAESEAALPYFEKAIELDRDFAAAYASLYDARMQMGNGRGEDLAPLRLANRTLIDRALTLDPACGTAYFARAMWGNDDYKLREADFRQGAVLDPSNGRGLTAFAYFLKNENPEVGPGDAERMLQRALLIDPMSPSAHFFEAVWSDATGESRPAVIEPKLLRVLELDPLFVPALQRYGKYRWLFEGKIAEAISFEERAIALDPTNPWARNIATAMYLDLGEEAAARDVAAGTRKSGAVTTALLALYQGDWRRAGAAGFDRAVFDYNPYDAWGIAEALRDYGLKSGEPRRSIAFLREAYQIDTSGRNVWLENFRPAFYVSQLLDAAGRSQEAGALKSAVVAWNDANESKLGAVYARRLRAGIFMLDNRRDAALQELAESFRANDYENWWYTLQYDPTWLPLHDDPRFQAIAADVRRHVAAQREELAALRQSGVVPLRAGTAVAH